MNTRVSSLLSFHVCSSCFSFHASKHMHPFSAPAYPSLPLEFHHMYLSLVDLSGCQVSSCHGYSLLVCYILLYACAGCYSDVTYTKSSFPTRMDHGWRWPTFSGNKFMPMMILNC